MEICNFQKILQKNENVPYLHFERYNRQKYVDYTARFVDYTAPNVDYTVSINLPHCPLLCYHQREVATAQELFT